LINLFKVRMSPNAGEETTKILNSGFIGQGPKVEEFEDLLWNELKSETRPVTMNSCTSAIEMALDLIGIEQGYEVISTPASCWASSINILRKKAKIVWADIDPITFNIDPNSVEKLITDKTKAIIAVNWAGRLCDYKKLKSFGIPVIEDAAHRGISDISNEEHGDYICYSFQAIKFLTTIDGGILIAPNEEKEEEARLKRWFGLDRKGTGFRCKNDIKLVGTKTHLVDVNATIGILNIEESKDSVIKHKKNSKFLIENIKNSNISFPEYDKNCHYWIFSISILNKKKDLFMEYMKENGIDCNPVHFRNDDYTCTKEFKNPNLNGVNVFGECQVCIPNGWWLSQEDLNYIVEKVNAFD